MRHRPPLIWACALWAMCSAATRAADAPAMPEWVTSADGAYVVHVATDVAWPRCVEGMRWNGRHCEGRPLLMGHADALALARSRSQSEGVSWRLPHLKELQKLARRNLRADSAAEVLLPVADDEWCWSGTAAVDTSEVNEYNYGNAMRGINAQNAVRVRFLHAWAVNMSTAEGRSDATKRTLLHVRLVRQLD